MKKNKRRIISAFLVVVMIVNLIPVTIFGAGERSADGLCEHHPGHTAECGYIEAVDGKPCAHQHTEACYKITEHCMHQHSEECYPENQVPEGESEGDGEESLQILPVQAEVKPTACVHECTEDAGCLEQVLNCVHVHDAVCGYSPALQGQSCTYRCEKCTSQEQVQWPQAPEWMDDPVQWEGPSVSDGEVEDEFYARPLQMLTGEELERARVQSEAAAVALDPELEITEGQLDEITFIYINGTPYTGGDITVTEGDNFSYMHSWAPNKTGIETSGKPWQEGSWFQRTIFKVPGLNLTRDIKASLVINGIKVGEYSMVYDPKFGEMTYQVVFNRYIQFFDPDTVMALLRGSGKFSDSNADGEIANGNDIGKLTIEPRPELPDVPSLPGGIGWSPSKAPVFGDNIYGFGKGAKWNSASDPTVNPQIEWRVVFLEQLQKMQREFLKGTEPTEADQYLIISDTLDANQEFYFPAYEAHRGNYQSEAPFFLELPVMVPGTGNILNGVYNVGNANYDGPGEISPIITGNAFNEIDGSKAVTLEEVNAVQEKVKGTPLTWAVTTDPRTHQQTLLINTGVLGTTEKERGITWGHATNSNWPVAQLDKMIADCDVKITALQNGEDSPITLLDNRQGILLNLLNRAALMTEDPEKAKAQIEAWRKDYRTWRDNPLVSPLAQLVDQNGNLTAELPRIDMVKRFEEWAVNDAGRTIADTPEYLNYVKSLKNLLDDQNTYLTNRVKYGEDWDNAKKHYRNARDFYEDGRVFGFVAKIRSKSINTSASSYENSVEIQTGDKKWNADDTTNVRFSSGIIGNYALGDVVLQKADAFYDTGDVIPDIQKVEEDRAGLAGARFEVYCGEDTGVCPELKYENQAHFLDKDASENGDTYRYTHTGDDHSGGIAGELNVLSVNDDDGKLILGGLTPMHEHWAVEETAPEGYYLDRTPIPMESKTSEVTYKMVPNHSRSVLLHKTDSFSGNPVEGAKFSLSKIVDSEEVSVAGFVEKNLNGHETLWKTADDSGDALLVTNEEGELCIHGLAAGSYVLRESEPAPGYLRPDKMPEFQFTLSSELPELDENGKSYDDDYHLLLNTAEDSLKNDPGVASLTLNKTGIGNEVLPGAGFALFRFTGTKAQWKENPDNDVWWEPVNLNEEDEEYFKTEQKIKEVELKGEGGWNGKELEVVCTEASGKFSIADIPVGHYSISEIVAPGTYERDYRSFYFTVDGDSVDEDLQLYTEPEEKTELADNTLKNYQKQAKLALVKYDEAGAKPTVKGSLIEGGGWQYTENVLADDNAATGLEGAVYKLFMRRGASSGKVNPHPGQLKAEEILKYVAGYDTCVAVGKTGAGGVLKLSDMKGYNGTSIQGLNPEEYYMIEITPPEGYLLDQTPIHFSLNERVFPDEKDAVPGLVMTASNRKIDYGLRISKVDASSESAEGAPSVGLGGAFFEVTKEGETAPLKFSLGESGHYRYDPNGKFSYAITGQDGQLILTGLEAGSEYTLEEVRAPQGYQIPEALENRIILSTPASKEDGVLVDNVLFPKEITEVANEQQKGVMKLRKQDAETGEALAGAEFSLYRTEVTVIPPGDSAYDPANPNATRSEDILLEKGVTGEDGWLTFDELEWHEHYFVLETKAPDGYLLDQTKRMFTIDENSFDAKGEPIPVLFPSVTNSKGTLGEAVLYKVDADDPDKKLEDAHFYLEKKMGSDADGKEIWAGYGQGMYITDEKGEIHFLLPPGEYKLTEMKAPDGYLLPENLNWEERFVIEEMEDGSKPRPVEMTVENRSGGTGVYLKKMLGAGLGIPGVTFRFYRGMDSDEPLCFIDGGDGSYAYTTDSTASGATVDLVTNSKGEIRAVFPGEFAEGYTKLDPEKWIYYEEMSAPEKVEFTPGQKQLVSNLVENLWTNENVENELNQEVLDKIAIHVQKMDGKSKQGLGGAEFELFTVLELDDEKFEITIAEGSTDENGNLVFDQEKCKNSLKPGDTYYLRETKAPEGYLLDETVHQITLDRHHFDEDFDFIPISLTLNNYQIGGSVRLVKVDADDHTKGLAGAEFELLRKTEEADPMDHQWEHYGEERYITGEGGELLIEDLPYGTYQLIERAAPLGYLLEDPVPALTFQIEEDGKLIELGTVTNEVDPNPVRDVLVQKVAAENLSLGLAGAEFQLYAMEEDGEYHPIQMQTYVTDASGCFTIEKLPVGSYALKELKAPQGYDVPEQNMTYFTVNVTDREVTLQITNEKSNPGGGIPLTSVSVQKIWEDKGAHERPDAVSVQLYRNGVAYGSSVELNEGNDWKHTWDGLYSGDVWVVDELEVPAGYDKTIERSGNDWTITNTMKSGKPTDPDKPDDPGKPDDPKDPEDPEKPEKPDKPEDPDKPTNPSKPEDSNKPDPQSKPNGNSISLPSVTDRISYDDSDESEAEDVPETGDDTPLSVWLALMGVSAAGIVLAWSKIRVQRRHKTKK